MMADIQDRCFCVQPTETTWEFRYCDDGGRMNRHRRHSGVPAGGKMTVKQSARIVIKPSRHLRTPLRGLLPADPPVSPDVFGSI